MRDTDLELGLRYSPQSQGSLVAHGELDGISDNSHVLPARVSAYPNACVLAQYYRRGRSQIPCRGPGASRGAASRIRSSSATLRDRGKGAVWSASCRGHRVVRP